MYVVIFFFFLLTQFPNMYKKKMRYLLVDNDLIRRILAL